MNCLQIPADPAYARLKQLVLNHTGLAYYADKDDDFAARISRRLAARGVRDCSTYLRLLGDGRSGAQEMDALIAELTIGETYFFRQPEHFQALRDTVLPEILERNRLSRRLRIWSAGCANGAEPYSIALLVREALGEQAGSWNIRILGTDINRRFLAEAEAGRYSQWAFREDSAKLKARYFRREGNQWAIAPEARTWVSFRYHNLAGDSVPPPGEAPDFDLIFCRNVMIYFNPELIRATAARLYDSLADGGWLVVGHAEPSAESFRAFRAWVSSGITLYRKAASESEAKEAPAAALPVARPALPAAVAAPARRSGKPHRERPREPAPAPAVAEVRQLADRGEWRLAAAHCRKLIAANGLNAAAHFMLALILEHGGLAEEAARSLRRAIYLDRGFAMAHYHLGLVLRRKRETERARKAFRNVLELLASRPDGEILEHGDGISAAELKELTGMQLDLLESE